MTQAPHLIIAFAASCVNRPGVLMSVSAPLARFFGKALFLWYSGDRCAKDGLQRPHLLPLEWCVTVIGAKEKQE